MVEERKGNSPRQPEGNSDKLDILNEMAADEQAEKLVQQIGDCIEINDHIKLDALLEEQKSRVDVTVLKFESDMNALAWAAWSNADQCFDAIYAHAMKYNFCSDHQTAAQLG